ncbi:MAG: AraC family transcriptional regulator [Clostridia bacterium]|nr:AraC family transcriptional regulator [Clostridia bacterium]
MEKNKKMLGIEHKSHRVSFAQPEFGVDFHWSYSNFTTYHEHDFYEFTLITNGKLKHVHNSNNAVISKGMIFLIKPNEYHQLLPIDNQPTKHIVFSIAPDTLKEITSAIYHEDIIEKLDSQELPILTLPKKNRSNIYNLVDRINQCPPNSKSISILIKTIIIELISFFIENIEPSKIFNTKQDTPTWLTTFLKRLNEPEIFTMQLKDIYPLSAYSQSMLNIYFKKYLNQSLIVYITKQKMNYACNLLQYTDDSPLDICCKLNYDSLSHFNRVFKSYTGKTPIAYRKSIKNQKQPN